MVANGCGRSVVNGGTELAGGLGFRGNGVLPVTDRRWAGPGVARVGEVTVVWGSMHPALDTVGGTRVP